MTKQELEQWAQSRELSFEIAQAIQDLCSNDQNEMDRVWNDPTVNEINSVMEVAWNLTEEDTLHWGEELQREDWT